MPLDRHTKTALRRELARAEEEQKRLAVVVAYLRERLSEDDAAPAASPAAAAKEPPREKPKAASRITSAQAAERVLRERGDWMRTPELLREVQKLGAKMKDSQNLYKTLDRSPDFRRHGRGLWGLAEWPNPEEPQNPFFVIEESRAG